MCPVIQPPNGTRDLYPIEAARRRFITEAWRKVSINHGFEEIDGPTFEHLELYTVKSGDGIVSELFSFRREGGEKDFALRPEFTPTLARMYAAKAKSLPKPTKWFTAGPFFRAERPQRGRLREFLQWNCDVIGLAPTADNSQVDGMECRVQADADVITCCVELLAACGLTSADVRVAIGSREVVANVMLATGVSRDDILKAMNLLDRRAKLDSKTFEDAARSLNWDIAQFDSATQSGSRMIDSDRGPDLVTLQAAHKVDVNFWSINLLLKELEQRGIRNWCKADFSIARGLAYYTGVVFEVIVDGERAVAGGGRYDNLIEMFGGPSTPAVGFGMGDVVLSLVLQDKGLMPTDAELLEIAGMRPDVFVIASENEEAQAKLGSVVAQLRRGDLVDTGQRPVPRDGVAGAKGLHVRRSYKSTKKIGKLLQEAADVRAKFAVILESGTEATVKNLVTGEQDQSRTPIDQLGEVLRKRL